ncbi:Hint domain-containing protein [Paracoccus sp. J56]|uniref:Hint domain-containing protein n=1 Tax=Paracoccus sp. J56 TaxID=935850 RepID=UPI000A0A486A|nr:Hint domain-containing protein [Paracoccus sp. J56]SMG55612.1 Hemolysin-type calcium-binding repeat-containing protein [Paracoccus sp. J56]
MPISVTLTSVQNIAGGPTTGQPDASFTLAETYDPALDTTQILFRSPGQTLDIFTNGGSALPGSNPDLTYEGSDGQEISLDEVQTATIIQAGVIYENVRLLLGYRSAPDWSADNGQAALNEAGFHINAIWAELTPGNWEIIGYTSTGMSIEEATRLAPGASTDDMAEAPGDLTRAMPGVVEGTDGDDLIDENYTGDPEGERVGPGDDVIIGLGGNDSIFSGAGNDTIHGGDGDDYLDGGDDDDLIDGGDGNDFINGEAGNDTIRGGNGNDEIHGGNGNDSLRGNEGDDTLYGGAGNDTLVGDGGNNLLDGGDGDDFLLSQVTVTDPEDLREDTLYGGAGNDTLIAYHGHHLLDGGEGNDFLYGMSGGSTLTGGEGFDRFDVHHGGVRETILITDFNTGTGQDIHDGDQSNNDLVDLREYYNQTNLDAYNAAHGTNYKNPLQWMRADQADDGTLNMLDGQNGLPFLNLRIENDGSPVAPEDLTYDNTSIVCFANGTLIETGQGQQRIDDLRPGDLVHTADNGLQPIRWIGSVRLDARTLAANPKLRPIRIRAGALGKGTPSSDLVVSPQHRVLVRSKIAQKMFGTEEVLVAARQLVQIEGIDIASDITEVGYFHMLFDRHEVVTSNGALTESLYTGPQALQSVGKAALEEIFTLFPQLREEGSEPTPARPLTSGRRARKLANRHLQHHRAMVG